jgi:hypothetical protein
VVNDNEGGILLDINPFRLIPAEDRYFVGRETLLDEWRQRLTLGSEEWKAGKGWLILAAGGMGKSSLLAKLRKVAVDEFKSHVIEVDFGLYHDLKNPEGLFATLESQIAYAPDPGTRAQRIVDLPPNASQARLIYKSAVELQKLIGLSVSIPPIGIRPTLPDSKIERPEDFALRIAGIYLKLWGVAGRSKRPIVILIDQLGKAHDDVQWVNIARLLLGGMLQLRKDGKVKIIFSVAMRPERYARLETKIQRSDLFGPDLFVRKYLNPFDQRDARQAIRVRAQAHFPAQLETGILQAIDLGEEIDPYRLIEAAGAVWAYLYGGERQRSPTKLTPEEISAILTNYYKDATRFIRETDETQWQVLKLLTYYPGGLTISDIAERFTRSTVTEIQTAVSDLLNLPGYQLISRLTQANALPRFSIAHELLHKALSQEIPESEALIEQARKTYEDAVWRFLYRRDVLSDTELHTIWEYRDLISINFPGWQAIVYSLLYKWKRDYVDWIISYPEEVVNTVEKIVLGKESLSITIRCYLILASIQDSESNRKHANQMGLALLARNSPKTEIQQQAMRMLARLGGVARKVLVDLARNSPDSILRQHAVKGLIKLGRTTKDELTELGITDLREWLRLQAAEGLARIGEEEISRDVLTELALNSQSEWLRLQAAEGLARIGEEEISRDVLTELALNSQIDELRLKAVEGLIRVGEKRTASEMLIELASSNHSYEMRWRAGVMLAKVEEKQAAHNVFLNLARNDLVEKTIEAGDDAFARHLMLTNPSCYLTR